MEIKKRGKREVKIIIKIQNKQKKDKIMDVKKVGIWYEKVNRKREKDK
jgi:hypothetical protein